jgi:uncharacterized membrane protein
MIRPIWNLLGPRSERGSALWWGFQAVGIVVVGAVLAYDGKWWVVVLLPVAALASYHTVKAMRRRSFF